MNKNNISNSIDFINTIVNVEIDRPIYSLHPNHSFEYQLNYGFVPNTLSPDGEELDAYILGISKPLKHFTGKCIAVIQRLDDNDDKLIIVPDGLNLTDEEIIKQTHFQEQFFQSIIIRK